MFHEQYNLTQNRLNKVQARSQEPKKRVMFDVNIIRPQQDYKQQMLQEILKNSQPIFQKSFKGKISNNQSCRQPKSTWNGEGSIDEKPLKKNAKKQKTSVGWLHVKARSIPLRTLHLKKIDATIPRQKGAESHQNSRLKEVEHVRSHSTAARLAAAGCGLCFALSCHET